MPQIRYRFLAKLLAASLLLIGLLLGLHTIQASRIPAALKRQAERAATEGKPEQTVHYLRQYLEFVPEDLEARIELATLLKVRPGRNPQDQMRIYEQILRIDPQRESIRREAMFLCAALGRSQDTLIHAEFLLGQQPNDPDVLLAAALANANLQRTELACQNYEAAIAAAPFNSELYQRFAMYLHNELKRPQAAREVVEKFTQNLPNDYRTWLFRAKFYQLPGQTVLGYSPLADIQKALSLDETSPDAWLMLGEWEQKQRRVNEARLALQTGLKHQPDDVRLIRAAAWLDLNLGNIGSAIAILERGLTQGSDTFDLLGPLGDLLVQLGQTKRTEEIIQELEAKPRVNTKLQVNYLKARLAMQAADWPTATDLLMQLRDAAVALPGLEQQCQLLLSACYQKQGRPQDEQETLKLVINKDPNHVAARVGLGLSLLNSGKIEEAIQTYEAAVRLPHAGPPVHMMLVRLKMLQFANNPASTSNDWTTLDRITQELHKAIGSQSSEALIIRADTFEARQDLKQAVALLRGETAQRPGDVKLWVALVDKAARYAGTAVGHGLLDEAMAAAGDRAELRLARAELLLSDPLRVGTKPLDRLLEQLDQWPDHERAKLFFGMAEIYDRLDVQEGVVRCYEKLCIERPTEIAYQEALIERLSKLGEFERAQAVLEKVQKLEPKTSSGWIFKARKAIRDRVPLEELISLRKQIEAEFSTEPNRADVCLVLSDITRQINDIPSYRRYVERAVRLEPTRYPTMTAYLAMLATLPTDDALDTVMQRLELDPRWAGVARRRVIVAAGLLSQSRGDDVTNSIRLLKSLQRNSSYDIYSSSNLASVAERLKLDDQARHFAEQAARASQARSDDFLRLIYIHKADVRATLAAAQRVLPPALFLQMAASGYEAAHGSWNYKPEWSHSAELRAWYQHRLNFKLAQGERTEAIELLEEVTRMQKLEPTDLAWAKRNLAMLKAVRGSGTDRTEAMKLLTELSSTIEETPEEKRNAAAVYMTIARHLDANERRAAYERAIENLEALVAHTKSPRDRYLLARVYRTSGNRKAVIESVNLLLQADPKNLDYLLMGLEETIELGELAAAKPFVDQLARLHGNDFRAVSAIARWEARNGRAEEAYRIALSYSRTADANFGDLSSKLARTAELLDELLRMPQIAQTEIAKEMLQTAVDRYLELSTQRADAIVAAVGLLAYGERHAEAFAAIRTKQSTLAPNLILAAGLAVLRSGGASERDFAEVKQWIDAAKASEGNTITILLSEGEYHVLRQDFAAAEAVYRKVLELDSRQIMALNNLAWILAPRPDAAQQAMEFVNRAAQESGLTPELQDTRARIRIAAKQYELAEKDLQDALLQQKTPLRMFHLALAKRGRNDAQPAETTKIFQQAKEQGLTPRSIHPADLAEFHRLDAATQRNQ